VTGPAALLRYNFVQPEARLIPYVQGGAGIAWNDAYRNQHQIAIGEAVEFTLQAGVGVHYLLSKNWAVGAEADFYHISNAGLARRNAGINAVGGSVGVTYYFP
jgi:opacity protein-like surface antigen